MSARIAALASVAPDLDAALAFHLGKSASVRSGTSPGATRAGSRRPPGDGLRVVLARAKGQAQHAAIGNRTGGRAILFLSTDDFARDHATMQAAALRFEKALRHEPCGLVAGWQDRFGNRRDLLGPRAASPADRP